MDKQSKPTTKPPNSRYFDKQAKLWRLKNSEFRLCVNENCKVQHKCKRALMIPCEFQDYVKLSDIIEDERDCCLFVGIK